MYTTTRRSDGGGKVPAPEAPLAGSGPVARFLLDLGAARHHVRPQVRTVNGLPGLVNTEGDRTVAVMGFEVADGRITEIDLVMNPDKLPSQPER
jgi:RNA polymerase sigma-70 factor, ECF subfamily